MLRIITKQSAQDFRITTLFLKYDARTPLLFVNADQSRSEANAPGIHTHTYTHMAKQWRDREAGRERMNRYPSVTTSLVDIHVASR